MFKKLSKLDRILVIIALALAAICLVLDCFIAPTRATTIIKAIVGLYMLGCIVYFGIRDDKKPVKKPAAKKTVATAAAETAPVDSAKDTTKSIKIKYKMQELRSPAYLYGAVAHLGEHFHGMEGVASSILVSSTKKRRI